MLGTMFYACVQSVFLVATIDALTLATDRIIVRVLSPRALVWAFVTFSSVFRCVYAKHIRGLLLLKYSKTRHTHMERNELWRERQIL